MGNAFRSTLGGLVGVVLILATGCDRTPDPKPPPATPPAAQPTAQPAKSAKPVTEIETAAFYLNASPSKTPYRAGTDGSFAIHLEGRGPWHVNQEYPFKIELTASNEAGLNKAKLVKEDAARWTEEEAHFDVPLRPGAAGEHPVSCDVSFSMCTPEQCIIETRTLALNLAVE